jgi:hypothetical protein
MRRTARLKRSLRGYGADDAGMSTAEYAVGTVAACAFGGALYKVVTSAEVAAMLQGIIHRALTLVF